MNVVTAREIMAQTALLIEHSAAFQAIYGRYYQLKPGSSEDAWTRYHAVLERQTMIARLLDTDTLENVPHRCGEWWKREDVIDTGVLRVLVAEVANMLMSCACMEAEPTGRDLSYTIDLSQRTIAGMLHPTTLMLAQSANAEAAKRSA